MFSHEGGIPGLLALGFARQIFMVDESDAPVGDEGSHPETHRSLVMRKATRAGLVGAATGLLLALLGQAAVFISERGMDAPGPRPIARVLAILLSTSLLGTITFLAAMVALGIVGRRGARRGGGVMTVAVVTAVATTCVLFHLLALALRILLGSSLTRTGIDFFMNSASHIMAALGSQYLGYVVVLLVACGVISAALAAAFRRALRSVPSRVRRVETAGCAAMACVTLAAFATPIPTALGRGIANSSPEIALYTSMSASAARPDGGFRGMQGLVDRALASPPLVARGVWDERAIGVGKRPNVVVMTLETVAISHVGFLGYPRPVTPNIDRIAAKSLRMTRAYTTATHSNYAQMAVISSLFPRRGTVLDMYQRLDYPRVLLHDLTAGLGYRTATISSQDETWQGMRRFEDTGTPTYFRHAPDHVGEHLDLGTEDVAPDHATVEHAARWIGEQGTEPFSVYINLQSTHFPYPIPKDAPRPFEPSEPKGTFNYVRWDRDEIDVIHNRYDNALHYVDAQVGFLYDALAARGVLDDTIFVVTADHGELFFEHDLVTHGRTLFDGESRVPLLVHYPAGLAPRDEPTAVSTLDVLPTIVDLMGLPPHPALQGESFARLGPDSVRTSAVFMNIQGWKHYDGIVCMPYKLVFDPDSGEPALYDLAKDPGELRDLADEQRAVAEKLYTTLRAQLDAQEQYHAFDDAGHELRRTRFAPRMLPCP